MKYNNPKLGSAVEELYELTEIIFDQVTVTYSGIEGLFNKHLTPDDLKTLQECISALNDIKSSGFKDNEDLRNKINEFIYDHHTKYEIKKFDDPRRKEKTNIKDKKTGLADKILKFSPFH